MEFWEYPVFYDRRINGDDFHFLHRGSNGFLNMGNHTHDYYELYMVRSGHINYNVEGHTYSLGAWDMIVTNTKEIHCPFYEPGDYHEISWISFKPLFIPFVLGETFNPIEILDNRKLGHGNKIDASVVKSYGIDKLFDEIEAELKTELPRNKLVVMGKLTELLCKIAESMQQNSASYKTNRKVHDIVKYINANLNSDLHAEELSRQFFLEKNYLRHLFKKETGYAVSDYVQQKRIIRARELMADGKTAKEAARAVGFKEYATFYRAFKRVTGVTPGEYRQREN